MLCQLIQLIQMKQLLLSILELTWERISLMLLYEMKHGMKQQLVIQLPRILLFTNLSHILDLIWDYSLLIRIRIQLILESISTLPRTITLLYNLELYRDKLLRPFYFWNNTFYGLWSCLNKFSIFSLLNTIASLPSPKGVGVWGKSLMQGPNQGIVWHSTYYNHLYPIKWSKGFLEYYGRVPSPQVPHCPRQLQAQGLASQ